jgi:formylglycine-generating enzyme required for sulfatase activity
MSPEHARGEKEIDRRADVYSLGIMLYESLAGEPPFGGDSALEIMVKAVNEPVPKPSSTGKVRALAPVDRSLERICLKSLSKDKEKRYPTAKALADELTRWLEGDEVEAAPRRVPRILPWAIAAVVTAAAIWFAFRAHDPLKPPGVVPPPPPPPPATAKAPPGMEALGRNVLGFEEFRNLKDDSIMVLVPAGEFRMGSDLGDSNEKPAHGVTLEAFLIDKTEVTVGRFRKFVEATGYVTEAEQQGGAFVFDARGRHRNPQASWKNPMYPQDDRSPVACVSYKDAVEYARWAGKRLPTEAEWEKAARGSDGRIWPWGNDWDPQRANGSHRPDKRTVAVGSFLDGASPYGVLDLAGNLSEIVADWFDPDYYAKSPHRNPEGPAEGNHRVVKGGSWFDGSQSLRASRRFPRTEPDLPSTSNGFRTARSLEP